MIRQNLSKKVTSGFLALLLMLDPTLARAATPFTASPESSETTPTQAPESENQAPLPESPEIGNNDSMEFLSGNTELVSAQPESETPTPVPSTTDVPPLPAGPSVLARIRGMSVDGFNIFAESEGINPPQDDDNGTRSVLGPLFTGTLTYDPTSRVITGGMLQVTADSEDQLLAVKSFLSIPEIEVHTGDLLQFVSAPKLPAPSESSSDSEDTHFVGTEPENQTPTPMPSASQSPMTASHEMNPNDPEVGTIRVTLPGNRDQLDPQTDYVVRMIWPATSRFANEYRITNSPIDRESSNPIFFRDLVLLEGVYRIQIVAWNDRNNLNAQPVQEINYGIGVPTPAVSNIPPSPQPQTSTPPTGSGSTPSPGPSGSVAPSPGPATSAEPIPPCTCPGDGTGNCGDCVQHINDFMNLFNQLPAEYRTPAAQAFMSVLQGGAANSAMGAAQNLTSNLLTNQPSAPLSWPAAMNQHIAALNRLLLGVLRNNGAAPQSQRDELLRIETAVTPLIQDVVGQANQEREQGAAPLVPGADINTALRAQNLMGLIRNLIEDGNTALEIGDENDRAGLSFIRARGAFAGSINAIEGLMNFFSSHEQRLIMDQNFLRAAESRWLQRFRDPSLAAPDPVQDIRGLFLGLIDQRTNSTRQEIQNLLPRIQALLAGGSYEIALRSTPPTAQEIAGQVASESPVVVAYRRQFLEPLWNLVLQMGVELMRNPLNPNRQAVTRIFDQAAAIMSQADAASRTQSTGVNSVLAREFEIVNRLNRFLENLRPLNQRFIDYAIDGLQVPQRVANFQMPVPGSPNATIAGTLQLAGPWRQAQGTGHFRYQGKDYSFHGTPGMFVSNDRVEINGRSVPRFTAIWNQDGAGEIRQIEMLEMGLYQETVTNLEPGSTTWATRVITYQLEQLTPPANAGTGAAATANNSLVSWLGNNSARIEIRMRDGRTVRGSIYSNGRVTEEEYVYPDRQGVQIALDVYGPYLVRVNEVREGVRTPQRYEVKIGELETVYKRDGLQALIREAQSAAGRIVDNIYSSLSAPERNHRLLLLTDALVGWINPDGGSSADTLDNRLNNQNTSSRNLVIKVDGSEMFFQDQVERTFAYYYRYVDHPNYVRQPQDLVSPGRIPQVEGFVASVPEVVTVLPEYRLRTRRATVTRDRRVTFSNDGTLLFTGPLYRENGQIVDTLTGRREITTAHNGSLPEREYFIESGSRRMRTYRTDTQTNFPQGLWASTFQRVERRFVEEIATYQRTDGGTWEHVGLRRNVTGPVYIPGSSALAVGTRDYYMQYPGIREFTWALEQVTSRVINSVYAVGQGIAADITGYEPETSVEAFLEAQRTIWGSHMPVDGPMGAASNLETIRGNGQLAGLDALVMRDRVRRQQTALANQGRTPGGNGQLSGPTAAALEAGDLQALYAPITDDERRRFIQTGYTTRISTELGELSNQTNGFASVAAGTGSAAFTFGEGLIAMAPIMIASSMLGSLSRAFLAAEGAGTAELALGQSLHAMSQALHTYFTLDMGVNAAIHAGEMVSPNNSADQWALVGHLGTDIFFGALFGNEILRRPPTATDAVRNVLSELNSVREQLSRSPRDRALLDRNNELLQQLFQSVGGENLLRDYGIDRQPLVERLNRIELELSQIDTNDPTTLQRRTSLERRRTEVLDELSRLQATTSRGLADAVSAWLEYAARVQESTELREANDRLRAIEEELNNSETSEARRETLRQEQTRLNARIRQESNNLLSRIRAEQDISRLIPTTLPEAVRNIFNQMQTVLVNIFECAKNAIGGVTGLISEWVRTLTGANNGREVLVEADALRAQISNIEALLDGVLRNTDGSSLLTPEMRATVERVWVQSTLPAADVPAFEQAVALLREAGETIDAAVRNRLASVITGSGRMEALPAERSGELNRRIRQILDGLNAREAAGELSGDMVRRLRSILEGMLDEASSPENRPESDIDIPDSEMGPGESRNPSQTPARPEEDIVRLDPEPEPGTPSSPRRLTREEIQNRRRAQIAEAIRTGEQMQVEIRNLMQRSSAIDVSLEDALNVSRVAELLQNGESSTLIYRSSVRPEGGGPAINIITAYEFLESGEIQIRFYQEGQPGNNGSFSYTPSTNTLYVRYVASVGGGSPQIFHWGPPNAEVRGTAGMMTVHYLLRGVDVVDADIIHSQTQRGFSRFRTSNPNFEAGYVPHSGVMETQFGFGMPEGFLLYAARQNRLMGFRVSEAVVRLLRQATELTRGTETISRDAAEFLSDQLIAAADQVTHPDIAFGLRLQANYLRYRARLQELPVPERDQRPQTTMLEAFLTERNLSGADRAEFMQIQGLLQDAGLSVDDAIRSRIADSLMEGQERSFRSEALSPARAVELERAIRETLAFLDALNAGAEVKDRLSTILERMRDNLVRERTENSPSVESPPGQRGPQQAEPGTSLNWNTAPEQPTIRNLTDYLSEQLGVPVQDAAPLGGGSGRHSDLYTVTINGERMIVRMAGGALGEAGVNVREMLRDIDLHALEHPNTQGILPEVRHIVRDANGEPIAIILEHVNPQGRFSTLPEAIQSGQMSPAEAVRRLNEIFAQFEGPNGDGLHAWDPRPNDFIIQGDGRFRLVDTDVFPEAGSNRTPRSRQQVIEDILQSMESTLTAQQMAEARQTLRELQFSPEQLTTLRTIMEGVFQNNASEAIRNAIFEEMEDPQGRNQRSQLSEEDLTRIRDAMGRAEAAGELPLAVRELLRRIVGSAEDYPQTAPSEGPSPSARGITEAQEAWLRRHSTIDRGQNDLGGGNSEYIESLGENQLHRFLNPSDIPLSEMPNGMELRPVQSTEAQLPALADAPRIQVQLPENTTFLVSGSHSGSSGAVIIGFLPDGRPVALKSYTPSRSFPAEVSNQFLLADYQGALLADRLGIGPRVHGIFPDPQSPQRLWLVTDVAVGDFPESRAGRRSINENTVLDLIEINRRLRSAGRSMDGDFQYLVGADGHVQVIDAQAILDSSLAEPSYARLGRELANIFMHSFNSSPENLPMLRDALRSISQSEGGSDIIEAMRSRLENALNFPINPRPEARPILELLDEGRVPNSSSESQPQLREPTEQPSPEAVPSPAGSPGAETPTGEPFSRSTPIGALMQGVADIVAHLPQETRPLVDRAMQLFEEGGSSEILRRNIEEAIRQGDESYRPQQVEALPTEVIDQISRMQATGEIPESLGPVFRRLLENQQPGTPTPARFNLETNIPAGAEWIEQRSTTEIGENNMGAGMRAYLQGEGAGRPHRFLPTVEIPLESLPAVPELRPAQAIGELPQSLADVPRVDNVVLPTTTTFLVSGFHSGARGTVIVGFLPDGRPVALKAYTNAGSAEGRLLLEDYQGAQVAAQLGIGPQVHGIYTDASGRSWLVTDLVSGDFPNSSRGGRSINAQTFADLFEIDQRVRQAGRNINLENDFQYLITPEGRIQIIDAGQSLAAPERGSGNAGLVQNLVLLLTSMGGSEMSAPDRAGLQREVLNQILNREDGRQIVQEMRTFLNRNSNRNPPRQALQRLVQDMLKALNRQQQEFLPAPADPLQVSVPFNESAEADANPLFVSAPFNEPEEVQPARSEVTDEIPQVPIAAAPEVQRILSYFRAEERSSGASKLAAALALPVPLSYRNAPVAAPEDPRPSYASSPVEEQTQNAYPSSIPQAPAAQTSQLLSRQSGEFTGRESSRLDFLQAALENLFGNSEGLLSEEAFERLMQVLMEKEREESEGATVEGARAEEENPGTENSEAQRLTPEQIFAILYGQQQPLPQTSETGADESSTSLVT